MHDSGLLLFDGPPRYSLLLPPSEGMMVWLRRDGGLTPHLQTGSILHPAEKCPDPRFPLLWDFSRVGHQP